MLCGKISRSNLHSVKCCTQLCRDLSGVLIIRPMTITLLHSKLLHVYTNHRLTETFSKNSYTHPRVKLMRMTESRQTLCRYITIYAN